MSKGNMKKAASALLAITMLFASFTACSSNSKENGPDLSKIDTKSSEVSNSNTLPIVKTPLTFKYWVGFNSSAAKILKSYSENAAYQEMEKRTGIKIEFIQPPIGQETEQYKLMIAANDLPDFIEEFWTAGYPGGPDKAIQDGMYLKLNDYVDKYAPNYKKLRESNKELAKQTVTDQKNQWFFPMLTMGDAPSWSGPILRKDWLDDTGLKVPTTISEWYTVLTAFKEKKGAQAPMLLNTKGYQDYGAFTGAFGVGSWFYKVGDKVKYGPMEQGFKDYLTEMNKWYTEGLIDKDFATRDSKTLDSMALTGKAGAWVKPYSSGLDGYLGVQKENKNYKLIAAPNPSLKPGDKPHFMQKDQVVSPYYRLAITTACKHPVEAVKWKDYHYSEEGARLLAWGIEGVSYKMVDGKPQFTDTILKDPGGQPFDVISWKYRLINAPYMRDMNAHTPYTSEVLEAQRVWGMADNEYALPDIGKLPDESEKFTSIMSSINSYVSQMILKIIIGSEPLSKFDDFVSQLKKMNIDEAIKIQQAGLDRYNQR